MKKVILITGASSGFGKIAATILHDQGHQVYGTSRNPSAHQTPYELLTLDVQDQQSIDNACKHIIDKHGHIDVLVNNAGILLYGALEESSEAEINKIMDINFHGVVRMVNAVLPNMRSNSKGRIINIGSGAGKVETPTFGYYCASKHAVEGYTKTLYYEVLSSGIDVGLVSPGEYKTEIFDAAVFSKKRIPAYDGLRKSLDAQMKLRTEGSTLANPHEVGALIAKCATSNKLKLQNPIGKFSKILPILNVFPSVLSGIVKKEFQLK